MISLVMALRQTEISSQSHRVQVELEDETSVRRVKICLEDYDNGLGWYTAASLSIPLHQLPLVEQALAEMRTAKHGHQPLSDNIIPFPIAISTGLHQG